MNTIKLPSVPLRYLTKNSIPSGYTLEYAAAKVLGIQDYDPNYIDALKDELDDPDSDIERSRVLDELEQYRAVKFFVRRIKNDISTRVFRGQEPLLVPDQRIYIPQSEPGPKEPDLDLNATTFTVTSLYKWFAKHGYIVEDWSDEYSNDIPHNEAESENESLFSDIHHNGMDRENETSFAETQESLLPVDKRRKLQENTKESLLSLIAILTEELFLLSEKTNTLPDCLPDNSTLNRTNLNKALAERELDGLSEASIGRHIRAGIKEVKNQSVPIKI